MKDVLRVVMLIIVAACSAPTSLADVQSLRVETVASPSWVAWKEIRVTGEAIP